MMRHRRLTDEESLADLLVLETLADEGNDFAFSIGQRFDLGELRIDHRWFIKLLNHAAHHGAFDPDFTFVDLLYRFEELIGGVFLQHDTHRATANGPTM